MRTLAQRISGLGLPRLRVGPGLTESCRMVEDMSVQIATAPGTYERKMKVLLITEGLGNRVNNHYYGQEAIQSAPAVFEGSSCYLDHPSATEAEDIPERRVSRKCGYFTDCRVESIGGVLGCTAVLHFDASQAGDEGYAKACTALEYQKKFPGTGKEYVGFSIFANGESEDRTVSWQGEQVDANYVLRFTDAVSVDMVTQAARGGKVLSLMESAAGARKRRHKEARMLKEALKKAHSALNAANKETDPVKKAALLTEATTQFNDVLEEAEESAERTQEAEEAAETARMAAEAAATKAAKEAKKAKKMADEDDEDEDAVESMTLAVGALLKEAKLDKIVKPEEFKGMTLAQAKEAIKAKGLFKDALLAEAAKALNVPVSQFETMHESERGAPDMLSSCMKD